MRRLKECFFRGDPKDTPGCNTAFINITIVLIFIIGLFWFAFSRLSYDFNWYGVWMYRVKFLKGLRMTLIISLFSLFISLFIGTIFAMAQRSRFLPLYFLSKFYVELIRGTPLLVQILVFFYVVAHAFRLQNRYVAGILILSFFAGAYISEIIRAGIDSVGRTQIETARSLGFTRIQQYRYIIFPQVVKRILPPLAGQFVSLIKDSSLLSIISVSEFTLNAQEVNAYTYSTLESYLPLALGYMLMTFPISSFTRYLERKYHYEGV